LLQFQIQRNSFEYVRFCRLYAALCGEDPVLGAYPTLEGLLTALSRREGADRATQLRLLSALLTKHQAAPSPLWSGIVLHAFHDMLGRLSRSLVGVERDEADALVAWALIEALMRVRPARDPDRLPMYLRQETRRVLFADMLRDARARQHRPEDEEDEDDARDDAPSYPVVGPETLADPASLVPIEERLAFREATAGHVSDEYLLRAQTVRGGLRRLTECLFEHASARHREQRYRHLLRRTRHLVLRRK
jgi:hypothetical protein